MNIDFMKKIDGYCNQFKEIYQDAKNLSNDNAKSTWNYIQLKLGTIKQEIDKNRF